MCVFIFLADKFHELCSGNKFKTIFDKITNNKPEVKLNQGDLSAALVRHHWNSTSYTKLTSCVFDVKLDNSYGSGSGFFTTIKKLKLRESKYSGYGSYSGSYSDSSTCIDFIRFTYRNGSSTREICGNIETTVHNNLIRNFFDETSGEMRVEISIGSTPFLSNDELSNTLEVDLVFTAYSSKFMQSI